MVVLGPLIDEPWPGDLRYVRRPDDTWLCLDCDRAARRHYSGGSVAHITDRKRHDQWHADVLRNLEA